MDDFKSIILGLCIASVGLGIIYMLKPAKTLEKSIRFSFAVVFLCITVICIASFLKVDFKEISVNAADYSKNAEEKILCLQARHLSEQILKSNSLDFKEIEIFTDKTDNGDIIIKRITVKSEAEPKLIRDSITAVIETCGVEVINE